MLSSSFRGLAPSQLCSHSTAPTYLKRSLRLSECKAQLARHVIVARSNVMFAADPAPARIVRFMENLVDNEQGSERHLECESVPQSLPKRAKVRRLRSEQTSTVVSNSGVFTARAARSRQRHQIRNRGTTSLRQRPGQSLRNTDRERNYVLALTR